MRAKHIIRPFIHGGLCCGSLWLSLKMPDFFMIFGMFIVFMFFIGTCISIMGIYIRWGKPLEWQDRYDAICVESARRYHIKKQKEEEAQIAEARREEEELERRIVGVR